MDKRPDFWRDYLLGSPIHGLPDLAAAKSWFMRSAWLVALLGAGSYCGYEVLVAVRVYANGDTTTKTSVRTIHSLPMVSVCQRKVVDHEDQGRATVGMLDCQLFGPNGCERLRNNQLMAWFSYVVFGAVFKRTTGQNFDPVAQLESLTSEVCDLAKVGQGSIERHEEDSTSLENLANQYDGFSVLGSDWFQDLSSMITSHKFEDMLLTRSAYHRAQICYDDGKKCRSPDPSLDFVSTVDNSGGICDHFKFKNAFVEDGTFVIHVPYQDFLQISIKFDEMEVLKYKSFPRTDAKYIVTVSQSAYQATQPCSSKTVTQIDDEVSECVNQKIFQASGCCICGKISKRCPKDAPCCTVSNICEAVKDEIGWEGMNTDCMKVKEDKQGLPCSETVYSSVTGLWIEPGHHPNMTMIQVNFADGGAVSLHQEVLILDSSELLARIGGVLGLFLGASVMSVVQMVFFCMDKAEQHIAQCRVGGKEIGTMTIH